MFNIWFFEKKIKFKEEISSNFLIDENNKLKIVFKKFFVFILLFVVYLEKNILMLEVKNNEF